MTDRPDTRTTENPETPTTNAGRAFRKLIVKKGDPVDDRIISEHIVAIEKEAMESGYDRGAGAVRRYNPPPVVNEDVLTEALASIRHKEPRFDRQSKAVRGRLLAEEYARLMDQPR